MAVVMVPPDGKEGIVFAPNANMDWTDEDAAEVAQRMLAAPAAAVLVMDCGVTADVLEQAAAAAVRNGQRFVLDPSPAENVTDRLIAAASIMVPNALEAEQLTGIRCDDASSAAEAGSLLLARGVAAACIKLPAGGAVLVEKHQVTHIGAVPVDVVDTTGAGDAFAAALAQHHSLVEAVTLAVAASHLAVTSYGAQSAPLTWNQLQQMARRLEGADKRAPGGLTASCRIIHLFHSSTSSALTYPFRFPVYMVIPPNVRILLLPGSIVWYSADGSRN